MPGVDQARAERLVAALRATGRRVTPARRTLLEQLVAAGSHLTAEELTARVASVCGGVHGATIYRSLDALEQAGLVEHVHLGHGRAVYHLMDDLHQHLVCEMCGSVAEAPPGLFDGVERVLGTDHGFAMRPYHFAVLGRCRECQAGTGPSGDEHAGSAQDSSPGGHQ